MPLPIMIVIAVSEAHVIPAVVTVYGNRPGTRRIEDIEIVFQDRRTVCGFGGATQAAKQS